GFCSGDQLVMPAEVSGVRGKSVNFTAQGFPKDVNMVTWTFTPKTGSSVPVYTATPSNEKVPDAYKGRVKYNRILQTLELSSLTPTDNGVYILTVVDSNLDQMVGQTSLRVLEPVADVTITSNTPEAVEFNSTVILTCNAKGSILSYSWLNNSIPVVVDGIHIVQNDSQLIINQVFRNDLLGQISCTAKNQLESLTSANFNLTVNYGPELVKKTQDPVLEFMKKGSNVTMSCTAQSSPAAEFIWVFNGIILPQKTATIVLSNLGEEQSGNYSCLAYNSKTQRYVTSEVTTFSVLEAISGTSIIAPTSPLIAGNSTVNLTCTSSMGKADSVQWKKDGNPLDKSNRISFSPDGKTVSILPVQKEDSGEYSCQLKNKISSDSNNYKLTVNYGPDNMAIKGDKQALVGQPVRMDCSFASFPAPTFVWKFNDTVLIGEEKECLTIPNFENINSGIYTCEAFNLITGLKRTATHNLQVKEAAQEQNGLSSGAIAGITIAVLIAVAVIIGVCIKKRRKVS
ncbi:carcinoembryonic antigen-related cell adhesion molecule 5 isoform X1, partial [Silurus asotus]